MTTEPLNLLVRPHRPRPRRRGGRRRRRAGLRHLALGAAPPRQDRARRTRPKAATSACACSSASRQRSSRPAPSTHRASPSWPSVPWRWPGWCRMTPMPAWPTPPPRRMPWRSIWWTPANPPPRPCSPAPPLAEDAALAVQGVTNSEGAEAGFSRSEAYLVTSAGFAGSSARTGHSVSASALAGSGTAMQRDYDYHSTLHLADLDDPVAIGRSAGERAVARLNPARPATAKLPVIYDPTHLRRAARPSRRARSTAPRSPAAPPS